MDYDTALDAEVTVSEAISELGKHEVSAWRDGGRLIAEDRYIKNGEEFHGRKVFELDKNGRIEGGQILGLRMPDQIDHGQTQGQ